LLGNARSGFAGAAGTSYFFVHVSNLSFPASSFEPLPPRIVGLCPRFGGILAGQK
jgi:hypothetical protein